MKRRLLACVLAVMTASGVQGSLMYAAAGAADARATLDPPAQGLVATSLVPGALPSAEALGDAVTDAAIQCLRGGDYCFGYGTWNCCGELAALLAIAGAVGAWAAAGLAAWGYWYYCG